MKILNLMTIALLFPLFESCNNLSFKKETQLKIPSPVSAESIIAKYKITLIRKQKISQGASGYVDTTFKRDLFIITDTISEIQVDNKGKEYIILGKKKKNNEDLKCYFKNDKVIDSLKVNQVITVSSNKHAAVFKSIKMDTIISVFVVEMANCNLIRGVKK